MWENAYLSIKNPKASRALKQALDPGRKLLASLAQLRFATSAIFGLSTWAPPLDQILDPHLMKSTRSNLSVGYSQTLQIEDLTFTNHYFRGHLQVERASERIVRGFFKFRKAIFVYKNLNAISLEIPNCQMLQKHLEVNILLLNNLKSKTISMR